MNLDFGGNEEGVISLSTVISMPESALDRKVIEKVKINSQKG